MNMVLPTSFKPPVEKGNRWPTYYKANAEQKVAIEHWLDKHKVPAQKIWLL